MTFILAQAFLEFVELKRKDAFYRKVHPFWWFGRSLKDVILGGF